MTSYEFGDVLLVDFPQVAAPGRKLRPAIVVLDVGDDDVVVVPITSVQRSAAGDHPISNWRQAGLRIASWVRLAKVTTVLKHELGRQVGRLSAEDRHELVTAWNSLYDLRP